MKVFAVVGITQSGKTTTIERLIQALTARGHRVGSVKEIHFESFAIDPSETSNTHRHRAAGAGLVCARGYHETDLLFPEKLPMDKILSFYEGDYDYVALEGVDDIPVPTIVTAHGLADMDQKWSDHTFAVSGRIASSIDGHRGVPAIDATADPAALADLIERLVYERLPAFPPECCAACGCTCAELGAKILRGEAQRSDCVADRGVRLTVGGRPVPMVPFVQRILRNAVLGVAGELDGYAPGAPIKIEL